jgi:hypothetical protein
MGRGTVVTRRTKDGKKRYYAAVWVPTPDGSSRQQWRTFDRKKDADAFLDDRSKEVRDGDYREPIPIRFDKFCDEWLEKYPRIAEGGELTRLFSHGFSHGDSSPATLSNGTWLFMRVRVRVDSERVLKVFRHLKHYIS